MVILSKFAENLFSLMQERDLNAPALGKIFNMDRSNITRYLRGERLPSYEVFIKIVEFFNVSADVLLGRQEYCNVKEFHPVQPFGTTLRKVLDETKTSQSKVIQNLHISQATIYFWLKNSSLPTVDHIDQLADYLEVPVDYLLGRIS